MPYTSPVERKLQLCPRCQQDGLYATGAFWRCASCGLAITHQALKVEMAGTAHGDGDAEKNGGAPGSGNGNGHGTARCA